MERCSPFRPLIPKDLLSLDEEIMLSFLGFLFSKEGKRLASPEAPRKPDNRFFCEHFRQVE